MRLPSGVRNEKSLKMSLSLRGSADRRRIEEAAVPSVIGQFLALALPPSVAVHSIFKNHATARLPLANRITR